MKKGNRVKTEIVKGFWFIGTYIDDFTESESILIDNKKMVLIAPKKECVLANEC